MLSLEDEGPWALPTSQAFFPPRYVELVNAACNFEPHESFFSLFSDPRSTRLTRIHLREDLVQDQDLEAIRKQVRPASPASGDGHGEASLRQSVSPGPGRSPPAQELGAPLPCACPSASPPVVWGQAWRVGRGCGNNRAVPAARTW